MDDEAGLVHRVAGVLDHVAIDVDLHQVRRRDLVVVEAEGVDQEVDVGARHAHRQVAVDQLGPAEVVDQPVGGRQLDPQCPFRLGRRQGVDIGVDDVHVHDVSPFHSCRVRAR